MIECPDCGKFFKSSQCSCGYKPVADTSKAIESYQQRLRSIEIANSSKNTIWQRKKEVLAKVKATGYHRWAYEIIALRDAGLYDDLQGIEMAERQIKADSNESQEAA